MAPKDMRSLFDVCRFIYLRCPEYRQAGWRTISHFLTDVEFVGKQSGDKDERRELRELLRGDLDEWGHLQALGLDCNCYGNGFGRINLPFNRLLLVPTERGMAELSVAEAQNVKYEFSKVQYEIDDPTKAHRSARHRRRITVDFVDRKARDPSRIALRRIDPAYVHIQYSDRPGSYQIVERLQPFFEQSIKNGELWNVNTTPLGLLQAVAAGMDFLYNAGEVFHLKAPHISGISNGGWGIPDVMTNFQNIHQLQVLKKVDEAVGLDYMLPMRMFFPDIPNGGTLQGQAGVGDMELWRRELSGMIKRHRKDPFSMHGLPFKVGYQEAGGAGKQLAPKESIAWHTNAMLNGAGYPGELYTGSMNVQTIPVALRLFENQHTWLSHGFNQHLRWVVSTIRDFMQLEPIETRLASPRLVDDLEQRNIYMQLAAGGEFTRARALATIGVDDAVEEAAQRAQEDAEIAARVEKVQRDAAQEAAGGSMLTGAGGAPGGTSYTPNQMATRAIDTAKQLLQIQFDGDRQKALAQLRATDENLYHLVKGKMEEMRNAARSEGGKQVAQIASA